MDVWRDDTERLKRAVDLDRVRAGVMARIARGDVEAESTVALRRYAAAALVLIAFGVAGAGLLGPNPGRASLLQTGAAIRVLEKDRIHHHGRLEWELNSFAGRHLDLEER
jgi:hypothetical protein